MKYTIYNVTIKNWFKYNDTKKKNHRKFMLANNIFEDAKIAQLSQNDVLIFIRCLSICGDMNTNSCQIHVGLIPKRWRVGDKSLQNALNTLQSFQLLSYEKQLPNTIEKKTKENKRKEKNIYVDPKNSELKKINSDPPILPTESAHPLFEIWNKNCCNLPKVQRMSSSRKKLAAARWKENSDHEYWVQVVRKIVASDFCNGSEGKWIANFDWFLKPQTHLKVIEGNYDNRDKKGYYMTHGMKIAHNAKMIDKEINEVFGGFDEKDAKPV